MTSLKFNKYANGKEPNLEPYKVSLVTMTAAPAPEPPIGPGINGAAQPVGPGLGGGGAAHPAGQLGVDKLEEDEEE